MCKMYFKEWLVVYFTFLGCVLNENIYKNHQETLNGGNTNEVLLHDMYMAFSPVTAHNTTNYIESVIAHMYNVQSNKNNLNRKSAMIFKLPYSQKSPYHDKNYLKQHQNAERVVLMERQQFMQPTFPNLTKSYMALRRFKFSHEPINSNITELMAKEINDIYGNANDDDWSDLGLSGWNGDIAGSSISPDHLNSNKLSTSTATNYPLIEITKDLTKGALKSEYFQQVAANALMEKNDRVALMNELDINVFIARANDPFGYSTKWQMKHSNKTKSKRDVLRLYSMIKCSTGCEPLVYKGYGCYCGFLGHGVPTDGIDRCCKLHDKCYGNSNCISYLEYFVPYVWKCYRGKPLCAIDHGEWGGPDSCAARLCYCDLRLSRCLRQYACPERRAVCRSSVARRLQNILLVQ